MNRKKLFVGAMAAVLAPLGAGELLNCNSTMELGVTGRGVPGISYYIQHLDKKKAYKNPDMIYNARTVEGGNPGRCMEVPGFPGVTRWRIELADFFLKRDGKVRISFDAKIGPDVNGVFHPETTYSIGFRCNRDETRDKTYPMLKGFYFHPEKEWKRFSHTFDVKAYTMYYAVWICTPNIPRGSAPNTLWFDNFRVEYEDGARKADGEFAATPDQADQIYSMGQQGKWHIRAEIPGIKGNTIKGEFLTLREHDKSLVSTKPVVLKREYGNIFSADQLFRVDEYGSFLPELRVKGHTLTGIQSPILVLHPIVDHPRETPGHGIGMNSCNNMMTGPEKGGEYQDMRLHTNGFARQFDLTRKAGMNSVRIWGWWRKIEYEKNKFSPDMFDAEIKQLRRVGQDIVFCICGSMGVGKAYLKRQLSVPKYLLNHLGRAESPSLYTYQPPMEDFTRLIDYCLNRWGNTIHYWEIYNEPGVKLFYAEDYIRYLKHAYKQIKTHNKDYVVLGNGVTGDFGMNVVRWCEKLNAADPNYTDHLDVIAFHPYSTGLDYIHGARNLYANCVRNIRNLTKNKPLWNTECYYLETAYRKQVANPLMWHIFGANEILRHYLDGMYHGVRGAVTIDDSSLFGRPQNSVDRIPLTEIAAAANALSWLLKDMVFPCEKINLGDQIRAGMFRSADGKKAVAFLYDFRITGSQWKPFVNGGVKVMDLYGNDRTKAGNLHLTFAPCFVSGSPKAVLECLKKSQFILKNNINTFVRSLGNEVCLVGSNLSGMPCEQEIPAGKEKYRFSFLLDSGDSVFRLKQGAPLPAGTRNLSKHPGFVLPAQVKLSQGSTAEISEKNGNLQIRLQVEDADIKPAANPNALWDGSCVEVFFDADPLKDLSNDKFRAYQYAFAVLPSANGKMRLAVRNANSKCSHSVKRTKTGYIMEITIPLNELPEREIYGMEIEIDRIGKKGKESFGGRPGVSYQYRLHYPLVRIPSRQVLKNGDFSDVSYGDPENWNYSSGDGCTVSADKDGVHLECRKMQNSIHCISQTFELKKGKYKTGVLQWKMKYDNVLVKKTNRGGSGILVDVRGTRGYGAGYAADRLKQDLTGSRGWQTYQLEFPIRKDLASMKVRLGLGTETTGKVSFKDVVLTLKASDK